MLNNSKLKTPFWALFLGLASTSWSGEICSGLPEQPVNVTSSSLNSTLKRTNATFVNSSSVMKLQSLPGASAMILLDVDGGQYQHPFWNKGNVINAISPQLSDIQVQEVWKVVSENFCAFNINVSTDSSIYAAMPNNRKVRVVVTPTQIHAGGGVAEIGSFKRTDDSPAWVFSDTSYNNSSSWLGMAASHEAGHTLGLEHDGGGSSGGTYYGGQGNWNTIMGAHGSYLNQWDKGEYNLANNKQNDLNIITHFANGVSFRADDYTDVFKGATTIKAVGTTVSDSGIIERNTDIDAFYFKTTGGALNLNIDPTIIKTMAMLDVKAWIENAQGTVIVNHNPSNDFKATLSKTLAAGEYVLKIKGDSDGDPIVTGHSSYGSIGSYKITGTIAGLSAGTSPKNTLPSGQFLYPVSGDYQWNGASIPVNISANDIDGTIQKVEFWVDDSLISTRTSGNLNNLTISWNPGRNGLATLKTQVWDDAGASVISQVNLNLKDTCLKPIAASDMSVLSFSSEVNDPIVTASKAIFAIDGDTSTSWATNFLDQNVKPPHHISVDMGQSQNLNALELVFKSFTLNLRPKKIQIFTSNDGSLWNSVGVNGSITGSSDRAFLKFPKVSARYFKLQIDSLYLATTTTNTQNAKINELIPYAVSSCSITHNLKLLNHLNNSYSHYSVMNVQGKVLNSGLWNKQQTLNDLSALYSNQSLYLILTTPEGNTFSQWILPELN